MSSSAGQATAEPAASSLADKFPPNFLEGVDFIETEEDAKAVEAATLKIQSTFRGKKFRSKKAPPATTKEDSDKDKTTTTTTKQLNNDKKPTDKLESEQENNKTSQENEETTTGLCKKVSEMQVNNEAANEGQKINSSGMERKSSLAGQQANAAEDEVERAATKIQAGFKGYKTRKELEGKLGAAAPGQQQEAAVTKSS